MYLGWRNEASAEQEGSELTREPTAMLRMLNITEGRQLGATDIGMYKARNRVDDHAPQVLERMHT